MKTQFQDEFAKLMRKDMDRKEFLKHIGIGAAAVVGLSGLVRTIASLNAPAAQNQSYGAGTYGGRAGTASR